MLFCRFSKSKKIWNIRFVQNLIGNMYWNIHEANFIIVTSVLLRTQSVQYLSQQFSLQHIESNKNNAQVQQTNAVQN